MKSAKLVIKSITKNGCVTSNKKLWTAVENFFTAVPYKRMVNYEDSLNRY
jgi:hypothetical protein